MAAGRAIVARRGAMRGIPPGNGAWIEVDTPDEMREAARRLQADPAARRAQMAAAHAYYRMHLDAEPRRIELKAALLKTARTGSRFVACGGYPDCNYTESIGTGVACPEEGCTQGRSRRPGRKAQAHP